MYEVVRAIHSHNNQEFEEVKDKYRRERVDYGSKFERKLE